MIANYGYEDATGSYFISIDTGRCNGCGECVRACIYAVLDTTVDDSGRSVAMVSEEHRKKLRYSCAPCKLGKGKHTLPCVIACGASAIVHSC